MQAGFRDAIRGHDEAWRWLGDGPYGDDEGRQCRSMAEISRTTA